MLACPTEAFGESKFQGVTNAEIFTSGKSHRPTIGSPEKAAFLIISARKEAAAVLARAGVPFPDDEFGNPCHAHIEAFGTCPCTNYMGDGGTCLNRITLDPGASAPLPELRPSSIKTFFHVI